MPSYSLHCDWLRQSKVWKMCHLWVEIQRQRLTFREARDTLSDKESKNKRHFTETLQSPWDLDVNDSLFSITVTVTGSSGLTLMSKLCVLSAISAPFILLPYSSFLSPCHVQSLFGWPGTQSTRQGVRENQLKNCLTGTEMTLIMGSRQAGGFSTDQDGE